MNPMEGRDKYLEFVSALKRYKEGKLFAGNVVCPPKLEYIFFATSRKAPIQ